MSASRIPPVEPPFTAGVESALAKIMPPEVPPLLLFRTLATNERVFLRLMNGGLLGKGTVTLREREIVIDRTCWRCGAEYEWGVHVAFFGPRAQFTDDEISGLCAEDPTSTVFSSRERLLLLLCDELHTTARLSTSLWVRLANEWTAEQLIELVALAGYYHLIAFAANAFELPMEPFAPRFPIASK